MKRLFTTLIVCSAIAGFTVNGFGQAMHSFELLSPNGLKQSKASAPFLAPRTFIQMGSHNSPLASEQLANFNSSAIDANGLVTGNFTTFVLPDTSTQTQGMASDGTYVGNQLMEYFTSTLSTIYLDSIVVGLVADTVPVKIVSFAYADTVNATGFPVPYVQVAALGSSQLLKSALTIDDTIRFYTFNYKHKLLKNTISTDPQSFFVSVSSLATTAVTNPFFVNPPTSKNRIRVLTDFFPEGSQRAPDQTTDKMYQSRTRLDGQWVSYGAVVGLPVDTVNGTFLYPNLIMWAFVSDGKSGVAETKLEGNALGQNYPNPFNPSTTIKYSLANESSVSLKVYNTLGVEVATILNDQETAGEHQASFYGDNLPSGTYFYTLKAGTFSQTKRMVLSK